MEQPGRPAESTLNGRELFLGLAILAGAWAALSTEAWGALHVILRPTLTLSWVLFAAVLAALAWRHRRRLPRWRRVSWQGWPSVWWLIVAAAAAALLIVALVAPPNTNDSLQYHMSRVAHWASQGSLDHYPTPIERQLWMPPFAEEAALNLYLLAGSDRLVNLVQWLSMILCLTAVAHLAASLGARPEGQALAGLFAATLPMGILQSTSTQNDYVTALWAICLAGFAVKAHRQQLSLPEQVLAGLAAGLGVLTKATFYSFALPFLVWLAVSSLRRGGWRQALRFSLLGIALVGLLNAGAWRRNLSTYGSPLGPVEAVSSHGNETWGWQVTLSNGLRGLTLHLATPYGDVNGPIRDAVTAVHRWIGLDINDPRTTMGEYRVRRSFHEDYAGNPYHTLLLPLCVILLAWPRRKRQMELASPPQTAAPTAAYALAVIAAAFFFFTLYKWQPTGSRLQLPLFVLGSPLIGIGLERLRQSPFPRRLGTWAPPAIGLFLTVACLRFVLVNPSRPLLPRAEDGLSLWNTSRADLLFVNAPEFREPFLPLAQVVADSGCSEIGLKIDSSHPEYAFWALLAAPGSGIRLEHIDLDPMIPGWVAPFEPCAIICTYCTESELHGLPLRFNQLGRYSVYQQPPVQP